MSELLANVVFIFHCFVILFIVLTPFLIDIPAILILHITSAASLLIHWHTNSDVCSLTVLEGYLRGTNRTDTFTHKFIGPLYNINTSDWSTIVHRITYILMFISIYKLYKNKRVKDAYECYNQLKFIGNETFSEKMNKITECFYPLFLL